MGKGHYRKFLVVGLGGIDCKCCFPQSGKRAGSKCRQRLLRLGTQKFNRFLAKEYHNDHSTD